MKKLSYFLVATVALFIVGLGFSNAAEVKMIKYGNISAMSGPSAPWGVAIARALRMAAEDIGTFTIAGQSYKWEVIDYDHKYNPADAVSAVNKAIFTDNIRYGCVQGAGVHPPVIPLLRQNDFVDMGMMAGGKNITNPENPSIFRIMASTDQLIMTFFEDIYRIYKVKRVAIIVPNDEMGKADWSLMKKLHQERKPATEIVAEEFFERGMTDFYPALKRMFAKNPDMIFSDASPTGTVSLLAKQSRELGFKGPIYNPTGALEAKTLWETAGKGSDRVVVPRIWAKAPNKIYSDLEKKYEEKFKEPMLGLVPEIYPLLFWTVEAMKKANSVDNEKVYKALRETSYKDHPFRPSVLGRREDVWNKITDRLSDSSFGAERWKMDRGDGERGEV